MGNTAVATRFRRQTAPEQPGTVPVRYHDEPPTAAHVLIHVTYDDGSEREWEAKQPQDFQLREGMTTRRTGLAVQHGGGFTGVSHSVPTLSLSFAAHPKHNLHIRTHGPWRVFSEAASAALHAFLAALGYQ